MIRPSPSAAWNTTDCSFFKDGRAPRTQDELEHAARICVQSGASDHARLLIGKIKDEHTRTLLTSLLQ